MVVPCPKCGEDLEAGACRNPWCEDWRFGAEFDEFVRREQAEEDPS